MKKRIKKRPARRRTDKYTHHDIDNLRNSIQSPKNNFLKYLRVVRKYMQNKHGWSLADLEMLLFLYSEGLFCRRDFKLYENLFAWDKNRFIRLTKEGHIIVWRERKGLQGAIYNLSYETKRKIDHMYKILLGEVTISQLPSNTKEFKKNSPDKKYKDKITRIGIIQMNENIKKNRRKRKEERDDD